MGREVGIVVEMDETPITRAGTKAQCRRSDKT